jgi:subtilisin family serine protease
MKKRICLDVLFVIVLLSFIVSGQEFVPGKFIVKLKPASDGGGASVDSLDRLNSEFGVTSVKRLFPGISSGGDGGGSSSTLSDIQRIRNKYPVRAARAPKDIDISKIRLENIYEFSVGEGALMLDIVERYERDVNVEYAEPIYLRYDEYKPDTNPRYLEQWAHQNIQSEAAWDIERGDSNIIVAIIDSGTDFTHEDLSTNIWRNPGEVEGDKNNDGCPGICGVDDDGDGLIDEDTRGCGSNGMDIDGVLCGYLDDLDGDDDENGYADDFNGWDFSNNDNDPREGDHGTHVAGIVAAVDNNLGIVGLCLKCTIMPIRRFFGVEDMKYAVDNGADVTSHSYGGSGFSQTEQDVIDYARSLGVVNVAAAGNQNSDGLHYPSDYEGVISVAATDIDDKRADFSNYGDNVDVAAPGDGILSTIPNDGYNRKKGTSMATPFVSGLAGLILSKRSSLTVDEIENIIINEVDEFGVDITLIPDEFIGKGRINALKALSVGSLPSYRAEILSPIGGSIFLSQDIMGIANGNSFVVEIGKGHYPTNWNLIGNGNQDNNDFLVSLDTTQYSDGLYTIKLSVDGGERTVSDSVRVDIDNVFIEEPHRFGIYRFGEVVDIEAYIKYEPESFTLDYSPDVEPRQWDSVGLDYRRQGEKITGTFDTSKLSSGGRFIIRLRANINGIESVHEEDVAFETYQEGWPVQVDGKFDRTSPVIANIDGIGGKEIIVGTSKKKVYIFRQDGSPYPGWEGGIEVSDKVNSNIAVGNLDSDKELEIIVNTGAWEGDGPNLYAFNHDGSFVNGMWPISVLSGGVGPAFTSSPVIIEINGDNKIMIGISHNGGLRVINSDGTEYSGFVDIEGSIFSSPAYGDLTDSFPGNEIVVKSCNPCAEGEKSKVHFIRSDGVIEWVKEIPGRSDQSPIIGDIDGDGSSEIVVFNNYDDIYVWGVDGEDYNRPSRGIANHKPISMGNVDGDRNLEVVFAAFKQIQIKHFDEGESFSIPIGNHLDDGGIALADVNGDGISEIIAGDNEGKVYIFSYENIGGELYTYNLLEGWPKNVDGIIASTPSVDDIDNDGDIDVVVGSHPGTIFVFDLDYRYSGNNLDWPMFQHDLENSGFYGEVAVFDEIERGDVNGDGNVDLSDAVHLLNFLFLGGPEPVCMDVAKVNEGDSVDLTDAVYLLNFLFQGGPRPVGGNVVC